MKIKIIGYLNALLEQNLILLKIKSRMDWVNEVKCKCIFKVNSKTNFEFYMIFQTLFRACLLFCDVNVKLKITIKTKLKCFCKINRNILN